MIKNKTIYKEAINKLEEQSLISVDYLKANSLLDYNITPEKIIFYIVESQELHLEPLLGTKLYTKLMDNNLSFEYELLMDKFVSKYLIHEALASYLKVARYSVQEGGLYIHTSTNSEPAEHFEVSLLIKNEVYKAHAYSKRMMEFLNKYPEYYPEWKSCTGDGIRSKPNSGKLVGGWGLQRTRTFNDERIDNRLEDSNMMQDGSGVCAGCPKDDSIFTVQFSWGNNDEINMGFDPATLSDHNNQSPVNVTAQPLQNYFWVVGEDSFDVAQAGVKIPAAAFSDPNADSEIFVKGVQDGLTWMRIKIAQVYENQVVFSIV